MMTNFEDYFENDLLPFKPDSEDFCLDDGCNDLVGTFMPPAQYHEYAELFTWLSEEQ